MFHKNIQTYCGATDVVKDRGADVVAAEDKPNDNEDAGTLVVTVNPEIK